jgi:hypothetical protein
MRVDPLITHRFPADQAPAAFGLLDQHLDQALGVLLEWAQEWAQYGLLEPSPPCHPERSEGSLVCSGRGAEPSVAYGSLLG